MKTVQANWEDDEKNRRVEFAVDAVSGDSGLETRSLTPKRVTFLCPRTKTDLHSIGIWTDKGRQLLVDQLHNSGSFAEIEKQIESGLAV